MISSHNELHRIKKQMAESYVDIQESLSRGLLYIENAESSLPGHVKKTSWRIFKSLIEKKKGIVGFSERQKIPLSEKAFKKLLDDNPEKAQDCVDLAYWHWHDMEGNKESYTFNSKAIETVGKSLGLLDPRRFRQHDFECSACKFQGTYNLPRYFTLADLTCPHCKHHLRWAHRSFGRCSCKRCVTESKPTQLLTSKYAKLFDELIRILNKNSIDNTDILRDLNLRVSGPGFWECVSSYDSLDHRVITDICLPEYYNCEDPIESVEHEFDKIFKKITAKLNKNKNKNKSFELAPKISSVNPLNKHKRVQKTINPVVSHRNNSIEGKIYLLSSSNLSKGYEDAKHVLDASGILFSSIFVNGKDAGALKEKLMSHGFRKGDIVGVVRGGGDLLNHESAKAFRSSELYDIVNAMKILGVIVITGIGHATDKLKIDEAASICAITPTAAAMEIADLVVSYKLSQPSGYRRSAMLHQPNQSTIWQS